MPKKHLIIIMGVSGSGKTTIAKHISEHLSFDYMEADDFHSLENKRHMQSGRPLTDDMRWPWIQNICKAIQDSDHHIILANSGLKAAHRSCFCDLGRHANFIYLHASQKVIQDRLNLRTGHFMPASLLSSQFNDMEAPLAGEPIYSIDGSGALQEVKTAALSCAQALINTSNKTHKETSCG